MAFFIFIGIFFARIAFAQVTTGPKTIGGILSSIWQIVTAFIPVAFGAAVVFFFFGMAKFILHAGDDQQRSEGKQIMLWGIIALFIISSIWGIVYLLANFFGVGNVAIIGPPQLPPLCPNGTLPPCS